MKDPKNIESLNNIVTTYITIKGFSGEQLNPNNPFSVYLTELVLNGDLSSLFGNISENDKKIINNAISNRKSNNETDSITVVSNSLVHFIVNDSFELYKQLYKNDISINPTIKEELIGKIGDDISFDNFITSSIETFKTSLFYLLMNFNSKKESYNKIKFELLDIKMSEYAIAENYEEVAKIRDLIKNLKIKNLKF